MRYGSTAQQISRSTKPVSKNPALPRARLKRKLYTLIDDRTRLVSQLDRIITADFNCQIDTSQLNKQDFLISYTDAEVAKIINKFRCSLFPNHTAFRKAGAAGARAISSVCDV